MRREIVIASLPYGEIIDPRGQIRMSSSTAVVTDATIHLYEQIVAKNPGVLVKIFIPGEDTFGPDLPSSGHKMSDQMVKKGIPVESIEVATGLNNTEEQIQAIARRTHTPLVVALDFHRKRTNLLRYEAGIAGKVVTAEPLVLRAHKGATKERLHRLAMTKVKVGKFGIGVSKIRLAELVSTFGVRFGEVGRAVVKELKRRQGSGSAIADYHVVELGSKHLEQAMRDSVKRARLQEQRIH